MSSPYEELKAITDAVYGEKRTEWTKDVLALLARNGIRERQDDGQLYEMHFSVCQSQENTLIVGLRYQKRDGSLTEDAFEFQPGKQKIVKHYRGKIEKVHREYKGTHKASPTHPAASARRPVRPRGVPGLPGS